MQAKKITVKNTFLLLLSLFLTLATIAQNSTDKKNIAVNDINYVEIVKVNFSDPTKSLAKKMSEKQYAEFAQKWNTSKPLGADKYKMKYYVYLFLKNGTKRQFTINGPKIQEEHWLTFDIGDKLYFDKLWTQ